MNDLDLALGAAALGAGMVRDGFGAHRSIQQKSRLDPVTEIDHASGAAIVDLITKHRPDDGILGEEGGEISPASRRWMIDPLDGTVNFVHGLPQFSVSVALDEGDEAGAAHIVAGNPTIQELLRQVIEPVLPSHVDIP